MALNKVFGESVPAGPLGARKGGRKAGFVAGRSFGLSKDKKSSAGARAGIGQRGRSLGKPKASGQLFVGGAVPGGPAGARLNPNPSVRLPNRGKTASAAATAAGGVRGTLGKFFSRFRKGR